MAHSGIRLVKQGAYKVQTKKKTEHIFRGL